MPFGLLNASSNFQKMTDDLLSGLRFATLYLHDAVVSSSSSEEHMEAM